MNRARLIRRRTFRAAHRYERPEWSAEKNREVFGAQAETHSHDWTVEVRVTGPIDPTTGFAVDLGALDDSLDALIGDWDGADLNRVVPGIPSGERMPSTEALAEYLYQALSREVDAPATVECVAVFESAELGSEFPAERAASR